MHRHFVGISKFWNIFFPCGHFIGTPETSTVAVCTHFFKQVGKPIAGTHPLDLYVLVSQIKGHPVE